MRKILFFLAVLAQSCLDDTQFNNSPLPRYDAVMKPIYLSDLTVEGAKQIKYLPNRVLENPGKIYFKGRVIFINDLGRGVHIYNNTDPYSPVELGFIQIPGNMDIAIKDNYLYADNMDDLVTIDLTDISNPVEISRLPGIFPSREVPPFDYVRYDCPDPSKGLVINWQIAPLAELENPNCYKSK
jgi:hypothetical protein